MFNDKATGVYPERQESKMEWLDRLVVSAGGMLAPWLRPRPERFSWIVGLVKEQSRSIEGLSDVKILELNRSLRARLRREGFLPELVAQSFALIR